MKIFAKYRKQSYAKGYTLIELLIYMGVLTLLIASLSSIFSTVLDVGLESQSSSDVEQDGKFILSRLLYDINSADTINVPASPGQQGATLQITSNAINYTYATDGNGNFQITDANGTDNLNSYDTTVSNLNFLRIGNGGSNTDTVKITFTVTSKTSRTTGKPETRNFSTTVGLQ